MCEAEARAAIAHDESLAKGHFRLAQALALQEQTREALTCAKMAIALCEAAKSDFGVIDELCGGLLKKIKVK